MKIAVVGAGFSGLAVAYFCTKMGYEVTLFDKCGIGAGASGIACGLVHCYAGREAKLSFRGHEALSATHQLFKEVGYVPKMGIVRPEVAGMDFSQTILYDDLERREAGLFIRSGATVNCKEYLDALFNASKAPLIIEEVTSPLAMYDYTIFTVGADLGALSALSHPKIERIRGQTVELEWPYPEPLPYALNAGVQFAQIEQDRVWAGATYERKLLSSDEAEAEIRKKVALFAPEYAALPVKSRKSGYRAATANKRPFIAHTPPNCYVLGGMGSKGLLYHALYAAELVSSLHPLQQAD